MPKGPKGQKCSADVTCNAILVADIATGDAKSERIKSVAAELGSKGGKARAAALSKKRRS